MLFETGDRIVYIGHNHACHRGCGNHYYWKNNYGRPGLITSVDGHEISFGYTDDGKPDACVCAAEHVVREEEFDDGQSRG